MAFFCWVLKKNPRTTHTHIQKPQTKPKNPKAISKRKGKVEKRRSEAPQGLSLEHSPYKSVFPKTGSAHKPLASVKQPAKHYGWGRDQDAVKRGVSFLCYRTFVWITVEKHKLLYWAFPHPGAVKHRTAASCSWDTWYEALGKQFSTPH